MDETLIFNVSQITQYIKDRLDEDFLLQSLCVTGEISNFRKYPSGHCYFTLKDEGSSIPCVMFRSNAMRLRMRPENGKQIIAAGRISVYPKDGKYQFYVNFMYEGGTGLLQQRYEQLKSKLEAEGLFDPAHKKPLPKYPERIALITSPAGAVVHDMLRIIRSRYPAAQVCFLPASVQGEAAPPELIAQIRCVNRYHLADVLIVGRGGGSMEDLWAFNDEALARAVYDSEIPVISAVGHEPDVTIIDYVADAAAATPTNGAEIATPSKDALQDTLRHYQDRLDSSMRKKLEALRLRQERLSQSRVLQSPEAYLQVKKERFAAADAALLRSFRALVSDRQAECAMSSRALIDASQRMIAIRLSKVKERSAALEAMNPLSVLLRGYSIIESSSGSIINSAADAAPGTNINIRFYDGCRTAVITGNGEMNNG